MLKKLFVFLTLLILSLNLFAINLKNEYISSLDDEQIKNMGLLYGLDENLSSTEMKELLLVEDKNVIIAEDGNKNKQVEIVNTDYLSVTKDDKVMLEGNVEIKFKEDNITIYADKMLLDDGNNSLSALGNVSYKDNNEDAKLQKLNADIVTYIYNSNELFITNGSTSTKRKTSEDEEVEFYTAGKLLSYRQENEGMFFQDGLITSNLEKSLATISAKNLAILKSGDMFLTNALLKLGRVPILYLPAFFYPSSKLVFNPAFGFQSSRGMFASFTYDVFGQNTNLLQSELSSFASLLQVESDNSFISDGLFYKPNEKTNSFETWISDTKSYLSIMADVYEKSGILLGVDTKLKYKKAITFSSYSSIIYTGVLDNPYLYFTQTNLKLNTKNIKLTLDLPMYSDPNVYSEYANRLSKISLDSFFFASQDFPDKHNKKYNDYSIKFTSDVNIPIPFLSPYFKNLKVDTDVEIDYKYLSEEYVEKNRTISSVNVGFDGTLLSFTHTKETKSDNFTSQFKIDNDNLKEPINAANKTKSDKLDFKLTYDFNNKYEHTINEADESKIFNETKFDVKLSSDIYQYLALDSAFKLSDKKDTTDTFTLSHQNTVSIPLLNLDYKFDATYYKKINNDIKQFAFTKDFISKNSITFSNTTDFIYYGNLDYDITYLFAPFTPEIKSNINYEYSNYEISTSVKIEDYKVDETEYTLGFKYDINNFSYDINTKFDNIDYEINTSFSLFDSNNNYGLTSSVKYKDDKFTNLQTKFDILDFSTKADFINSVDELKINYMDFYYKLGSFEKYQWYNRIKHNLSIDSVFRYNFINKYNTYFDLSINYSFIVKEYVSFKIKFLTGNNNFNKYYDINDNFIPSLLFDDLISSFDFITGGNTSTNFNMKKIELEFIYFMHDWDFHFDYITSFKQDGYQYSLTPEFKIYLQWKTIPDLEVKEKWEYSVDGFKKI